MCPSLRGVTVANRAMGGHRHSEGGAGDYTTSCLGFGFINEAVGLTATEAAVGIALARVGVLPKWRGLQERVGTTRTAVGSCRLVLGAAGEVSSQEGSQQWEVLRHSLPLLLLNLAVAFKGGTGTVVVAIVTDPTWLSEASDGRHCRHGGERR